MRRSNEDRSRSTRAHVIEVARQLFATQGYAATTLTEIASCAGVSTGALYHHWTGKAQLLAAVVAAIHLDLAREIAVDQPGIQSVETTTDHDPLDALEHAARVFLHRCTEPDVGRLLLIEAPAVLGETWHELDQRWWQQPTTELLRRAAQLNLASSRDPAGYATALLGSLTALGRGIAAGHEVTPQGAEAVFHDLIEGIRHTTAHALIEPSTEPPISPRH